MAVSKASPSATRYQKLLDRVAQLNLDSGGFWKPPVGNSTVRVLPPVGSMGDVFFKEVGKHYLSDDENFTCPKLSAGERCPICEVNEALYEAGEKDTAKRYHASRAFYMNVIVRGKEDAGPMIWSAGITLLQAIVGLINDPDYGDISDPDNGFDLKLERTGEGKEQTKYSLRASRHPSSLSPDPDKAEEWMSAAKDLESFVNDKLLSYDELAKKSGVDAYMVEDGDAEEPAPPPPPKKAPPKAAPPTPKAKAAPAPVRRAPVPEPDEDLDDEDLDDEDEDGNPPARPASRTISDRLAQHRAARQGKK